MTFGLITKEAIKQFLADPTFDPAVTYVGRAANGNYLVFTDNHPVPDGATMFWSKETGMHPDGAAFLNHQD